MRVKKQKRHRRAVRFYTVCFGFREPFKVLCDGTFVHHLIVNSITPADTALTNILGATVKLFTTRCVLAELKSLGASYRESLNAANNLIMARCDHEQRKSAVDCITEVIGENNSEHFFVATQDADLRRSLQKIPGVPLIYALRNALFLEKPSSFQRQFAQSAEEERLHMTDMEYNMLRLRKKRKSSDDKEGDSSDEEEVDDISQVQTINTSVRSNGSDGKDKVRFKRKKAKGPNPLSVKKKKKSADTNSATSGKESKHAEGTVRSRKKRKRSRKSVVQGNA
ncbi:rRNA-processing protein utp23 [Lycium ferocissimum]|uniref:rRNA-processing protein utp23 n=1 Tax=Lycium ferocissimum TaxID=112874 RepID=UPI002815A55E|nr:rRNA-processing protein utp23 [Lycium ferocissimum]XP_059308634.1 rRNA-processing protein utp23 [Lycium ferocissimum]